MVIPKLVSGEEKFSLISIPSHIEIKDIVFAMDKNIAPGPNSFGVLFFTLGRL